MVITQKYINDLAYKIVGCAIEVHKNLGPGLIESVYEKCLIIELKNAGLDVKAQVPIDINYKEEILNSVLRIDLLINDLIIVEIKAVESMTPLFTAQLMTYLKIKRKTKRIID